MSTRAGSNIVQDSLVLSVDPANYKSYNGENDVSNLCLYPEDLSSYVAGSNYTGSTANAINAPDGTLTADKVYELSGTNTIHIFNLTGFLTSGIQYKVSFFAKAGERSIVGFGSNNGLSSCIVNLNTGAVISGSATVVPLSNGWYHIKTTVTPGGGRGLYFGICNASGSNTYNGDGSSGLYVWGVKAELNSQWSNYTSIGGTQFYTSLYDKSTNSGIATLNNGAVYNSSNKGIMVFDRTGYAKFGAVTGSFSQFSITCWFNANSLTNYSNVLDFNYSSYAGTGNVGPRLEIYSGNMAWELSGSSNNEIYNDYLLNASPQASTWYFAAIVRKSNGTVDTYLNDVQIHSGASNSQGFFNVFGDLNIGRGWQLNSTPPERYFNGKVGQVLAYNTALTSSQILQNFNATRGRYGV